MRLRRFAGLVAALTMSHFVLVTGELECVRVSHSSDSRPAHEMTSTDGCAHAAASHTDAPLTPPGTPARHAREHGAFCCAALAGCVTVIASVERALVAGATVLSTRITSADSDGVAPPRLPPDPPPPKA